MAQTRDLDGEDKDEELAETPKGMLSLPLTSIILPTKPESIEAQGKSSVQSARL